MSTAAAAGGSAGVDPILASVLQRRVQAITHEMATVPMRSSRSPIFNEIGDLVTVLFDRRGRTLAQTEYASIIANGAQPTSASSCRSSTAARWSPGRRARATSPTSAG